MKSIKLYVNVVPLLIILALIGGAGYFLFGEDLNLPTIEERRTQVTRIEGFPRMIYVDEDREKIRTVIKTEEQLNEFLNQIDPNGNIDVPQNVNFNRHYLIGAATKMLEGENHKFKIRKLNKDTDDQTLTVMQERVDPDGDCKLEGGENIWVDLVKINKTDWKIDFELVKKTLPCEENDEANESE